MNVRQLRKRKKRSLWWIGCSGIMALVGCTVQTSKDQKGVAEQSDPVSSDLPTSNNDVMIDLNAEPIDTSSTGSASTSPRGFLGQNVNPWNNEKTPFLLGVKSLSSKGATNKFSVSAFAVRVPKHHNFLLDRVGEISPLKQNVVFFVEQEIQDACTEETVALLLADRNNFFAKILAKDIYQQNVGAVGARKITANCEAKLAQRKRHRFRLQRPVFKPGQPIPAEAIAHDEHEFFVAPKAPALPPEHLQLTAVDEHDCQNSGEWYLTRLTASSLEDIDDDYTAFWLTVGTDKLYVQLSTKDVVAAHEALQHRPLRAPAAALENVPRRAPTNVSDNVPQVSQINAELVALLGQVAAKIQPKVAP